MTATHGAVRRPSSMVLGLAALGIATSVLLTGCSLIPHLGSSGGSGSSSSSDSGTSSDSAGDGTTAGDAAVLGGKPASFPADIPIIDGDIPFGIDLGTGWSVIVTVSDVTAGYTEASDKLKAAGFTADMESVQADGSLGTFTNGTYRIQVTAASSTDYGPSVSYVVVLVG